MSEYTAKPSCDLRLQKGILSMLETKQRVGISQETKESVLGFYESEEISRLLSGKKDVVSVWLPDKTRIKKQKGLLLCNISEIYEQFKKENPNKKIGFSKFAVLCPKWCIPLGAAGTHNVCVCMYHQNVKLMLVAMNSSPNYKQIIEMCVCDVDKYECMMGYCDDCPDPSELKRFLKNELLKTIDQDEAGVPLQQFTSNNPSFCTILFRFWKWESCS